MCSPVKIGLYPRRVKKTCSPKSTIFQVFFPFAVGFSCISFATHLAECWNKVKTVGGLAHGYIHCSLCRLAIAPDVSKKPIEVWLHLTNVDGNMVSGDTGKWGWSVVVGFAAFRHTSYILPQTLKSGTKCLEISEWKLDTEIGRECTEYCRKWSYRNAKSPCVRTGRHCIVFAGWSCWGLPCQRLMMYMERRIGYQPPENKHHISSENWCLED